MLYGDGTVDAGFYELMVPHQYGLGEANLLGLNIGKIIGGVVKAIPGVGQAVDIATGLISPGGGGASSGGRSPEVLAKDAADQARYYQLAKAGDTTTIVESGMTAEQRLRWEASPANYGNPAEVVGAQRYLAMLAQDRASGAAAPAGAPGVPTTAMPYGGGGAGLPSWVLPLALGVGAAFLLPRLFGPR